MKQPKQQKTYAQKYKMSIAPSLAFALVEKMLYKHAWRTTHLYRVPFEEARSEVIDSFMRACWMWKPEKGEFTTLCWLVVEMRLKSFITRRAKRSRNMPEVELNDAILEAPAPPDSSGVMELIEDLSDDAKELVDLILEIPEDLLGKRMTPKQLMRAVKRYLIKRKGRDAEDVERAHRELRNRFAPDWLGRVQLGLGFIPALQPGVRALSRA